MLFVIWHFRMVNMHFSTGISYIQCGDLCVLQKHRLSLEHLDLLKYCHLQIFPWHQSSLLRNTEFYLSSLYISKVSFNLIELTIESQNNMSWKKPLKVIQSTSPSLNKQQSLHLCIYAIMMILCLFQHGIAVVTVVS